MLIQNQNPQGYKENLIYFIDLYFGEGVTIIYRIENMKLYTSNIEESYKDTIIGHMGNSDTADLLLYIVQYWRQCVVNEEKQSLPIVLHWSSMIYKYNSHLGFFPINTQRGRGKYQQ